jgi:DNA-binding transcriptional ArsR family regulator
VVFMDSGFRRNDGFFSGRAFAAWRGPALKLSRHGKFSLTTAEVRPILSFMAKYSTDLDRAFSALADPTRRAIVARLCGGPRSVSELSEPFEMALPSLLKHVRVLEQSGLVRSEKIGRVRTCRIEAEALRATQEWLRRHISEWEKRLDRLEIHIEGMKRKN